MGIQIASNFKYNGPLPNFERDMYKTIAEMVAVNDATLPEVFIATNVEEPSTVFIYSKTNDEDAELGKWRRVTGTAITIENLTDTIKKWGSSDTLAKLKEEIVADAENLETKYQYLAEVTHDESKDNSNTLYLVSYNTVNDPATVNDFTFDFLCYVGVSEKAINDKVDKSQLGVATVELKENEENPDEVTGVVVGVATLDITGKVPVEQLPSYVDDVVEGYFNREYSAYRLAGYMDGSADLKLVTINPTNDNEIALSDVIGYIPELTGDGTEYVVYYEAGDNKFYEEEDFFTEIEGEKGKIYVDIATGNSYRFSGTVFVQISNSDAEKNVITGIKVNGNPVKVDADRTVNINLGNIGSDASFTTSSPVNNPIGRFKNGEVVTLEDNMSLVDAINKLLHKYVPATVVVTTTPATSLYEAGTNVENVEVTVNVTKGSNDITGVELFVDNVSVATFSDVENGGTYNYTLPTFTSDTVIKAVVTDDEGSAEQKLEIKFANKTYFGVVDNGTVVDDVVLKGLNDTLKLSAKYTYNDITANDSHIVYAYPKSMGNLTSIKDGNGFEYLGSYTKSIVAVDGVDYNVYKLTSPASVTNFKQIFA